MPDHGNRFGLPYLGFGLGLRHAHHAHILEYRPPVGWFEIIAEDFMDGHSGHFELLANLRRTYPIVMHGVSLSLGSPEPLNRDYLKKLKRLADCLDTPWFSDHLCWTGVHGINTHDLLPVPYTEEALRHFTARIRDVQNFMGRPLALENPSTYLDFSASTMPEWEFLARLADAADCALLLDVNNVFVSAYNHEFDAQTYLAALPADRIVQIHLAGHLNRGSHIVDTHDDAVSDAVWELYRQIIRRMGPKSTMIEWDAKIPEFPALLAELQKAKAMAS